MSETPFRQYSIATAERFLQTVVVVDDRASFSEHNEHPEIIDPSIVSSIPENTDQNTANTISKSQHGLDAKALSDAFADKGLACAILRPELSETEPRQQVITRTLKTAHRADILILDWQLDGQNNSHDAQGQISKDIILKVLRNKESVDNTSGNQHNDGQLCLIAIYTGDPDLNNIRDSIKSHLEANNIEVNPIGSDNYTLKIHRARIEIYLKENAGITPETKHRQKTPIELPEALIKSFSDMTEGLVSSFAVNAISSVRSNTYNLLSRLQKNLDGPYLLQRALTPPEDSFDFLINLISSELQYMIKKYINEDDFINAIYNWLELNTSWNSIYESRDLKKYLSKDDIFSLITTCNLENTQFKRDKLFKYAKDIFSGEDSAKINAEFAILSTIKSHHANEKYTPILTLGTVIEEENTDNTYNYLLCIQPKCDSVRLSSKTYFPLLSLEITTSEDKFDLIINNGQGIKYLKIPSKLSKCRIIEFDPQELGVIKATLENDNNLWFHSKPDQKYRYICDLKDEYAQRVINTFTSITSRIGINELEWLRLHKPKN